MSESPDGMPAPVAIRCFVAPLREPLHGRGAQILIGAVRYGAWDAAAMRWLRTPPAPVAIRCFVAPLREPLLRPLRGAPRNPFQTPPNHR